MAHGAPSLDRDVTSSDAFRSLPFISHEVVSSAIDAQLNNVRAIRPLTCDSSTSQRGCDSSACSSIECSRLLGFFHIGRGTHLSSGRRTFLEIPLDLGNTAIVVGMRLSEDAVLAHSSSRDGGRQTVGALLLIDWYPNLTTSKAACTCLLQSRRSGAFLQAYSCTPSDVYEWRTARADTRDGRSPAHREGESPFPIQLVREHCGVEG